MVSVSYVRLFFIYVITAAVYAHTVQSRNFTKRKLSKEAKITSEVNSFHSNKTWHTGPSTQQKQVQRRTRMDASKRKISKSNIIAEVQNVMCKPRPTIVPLPTPPHDYAYIPHCVIVNRCSGCCNSDVRECVSVKNRTIRKMVFKDKLGATKAYKIPVQEDEKCVCKCKQVMKEDCSQMQVYDEDSCGCVCPNAADSDHCGQLKLWDPQQCKCVCKNSICSTGNQLRYFNEETCRCEVKNHLNLRRYFRPTVKNNDVLYGIGYL